VSRRARDTEPDSLDLLEEAAHLLRSVPASVHATYLAGTVPFLLGLLFFVAEMSRGAHAESHAAEAALGLVGLFAWMKTLQAVAAGHALAHLEQRAPGRLGFRFLVLLAARQLRLHTIGLVVLPLAAVSAVPFGWVYAWCQNVTVLGLSEGRGTHRAGWEQARLWPVQNHLMLGLLALLGLVAFLDVAIMIYAVPDLLRTLLGVEQVLATTGWNAFNTTFLAAAFALTHLVVDPFVKAVYVVRCFHGLSLRSGLDLLVQVRTAVARLRAAAGVAAVLLAACLLVGGATGARAEDGARDASPATAIDLPIPPGPDVASDAPPAVAPARLDAALDEVLARPEYAWRLPRAKTPESERGVIAKFFESIFDWIKRAMRWLGRMIEKFFDWLFDRGTSGRAARGGGALADAVNLLLGAIVVLLVGALAWFLWRWWQRSRAPAATVAAPVVTPVLEREDLTADQLPEDEWMRLAREMMARGDVRQALRALFLGSLAALGARGLLVLARHKSNRDYERELARRGDTVAPVAGLFGNNRRLFECVWYGHHAPADDEVRRFEANVRELRGGGGA
jgi:hypothetical protein